MHSAKQEQWNKLTCWLCGKTGHTANRCPVGEESKRDRGKNSQSQKKNEKMEIAKTPMLCMQCGSRTHKADHFPNVVIKDHPQIQQQQLLYSSTENSSSSSIYSSEEEYEELNLHAQAYNCSDSEECQCKFSNIDSDSFDDSSDDEPEDKAHKEKLLMAQTKEEEVKLAVIMFKLLMIAVRI